MFYDACMIVFGMCSSTHQPWLCLACVLRPTNHEPVYGIRHIGERIIRGCASAVLHEWCLSHWLCHMNHVSWTDCVRAHEACLHMNEWCHTYEWVVSHPHTSHVCTWMSGVTHINESCYTRTRVNSAYEGVLSQMWMGHVTRADESYVHVDECVTIMNRLCTRTRGMFAYEWVWSQIWMSRVTRAHEPCLHESCISLIHKRGETLVVESCVSYVSLFYKRHESCVSCISLLCVWVGGVVSYGCIFFEWVVCLMNFMCAMCMGHVTHTHN